MFSFSSFFSSLWYLALQKRRWKPLKLQHGSTQYAEWSVDKRVCRVITNPSTQSHELFITATKPKIRLKISHNFTVKVNYYHLHHNIAPLDVFEQLCHKFVRILQGCFKFWWIFVLDVLSFGCSRWAKTTQVMKHNLLSAENVWARQT